MFWLKSAIQAVPSACSRWPPVGSGALRSKTPMLSRPRNPPSNTLLPVAVLAVHPPGEVQRRASGRTLSSQSTSPSPGTDLLELVREDGRPGVHGRVHVAEVPFVRRNLAVRVQVAALQHQVELLLAELRVDHRQGEDVKREIPRGVPRVLPLVRHRDDVGIVHVVPVRVARRASPAERTRRRARRATGSRRSSRTACSRACRRAPAACTSASSASSDDGDDRRRRTRRPRCAGRPATSSNAVPNGPSARTLAGRPVREPQPRRASPRRASTSAGSARRPWCRSRRDSRRRSRRARRIG